jgi:hypothetical protein
MAIGTSVKVGFDGSEVKKGFSGIGGMFKSIGKGMAIGAGAMMSKSLLDLGLKLATGIDQLADFAGEAQDTALQVGATTSEIIKLDRALALSGAAIDTGRLLSTMTDNIYDASHGSEDLQKTFGALGLTMADLAGKKTIDQFMMIGKAVATIGENGGETEKALKDIFGGKMYMQLLKLFRNQDVFEQANKELDSFGKNIEDMQDNLGKTQDQFQRIPYLWKSFNLALARGIDSNGNFWKKLFDGFDQALNEGNFSKLGYMLKSEFAKALEVIAGSGALDTFKNFFRDIGKYIGEGISSALPKLPSLPSLPTWLGGDGGKTSMIDPISEIQRTNSLLEKIYRTGGALYA